MKLYYLPGACSLADHIALHEAGAPFERERVDLKTRTTETGADFLAINPKGYVPALVLESGETLSENIAVLDWIAGQYPQLGVPGALGRTRLLEALAFISTEIHRSFKPMWHGGSEAELARARTAISALFDLLAAGRDADYLFGPRPSVADFYLFVMLLWAERFAVPVPERFAALRTRMMARPAAQRAMRDEGLIAA
ncbi:MAG: glutathione S-transferase C-terminal domain-containing protein [Micropepsaceae bacterium]